MPRLFATVALALALTLLAGCRVESHKSSDNNEDVKIATPFGGMSVKTNEKVVEGGVGLSVYPGASLIKKDKDNGAADVNMSFGNFHLGVKALSYQTADAPDKVLAFYRKDMSRYGAVILCRGKRVVGTPERTQDGLSCNTDHGGANVQLSDGQPEQELKAGSRQHQHIVAIDPRDGGTKIGLVALDLPGHLGNDSDENKD